MDLRIVVEQEDDGRWIAEIPELPGVMAYANSKDVAVVRVVALALRVVADKLEHGELEAVPAVTFTATAA